MLAVVLTIGLSLVFPSDVWSQVSVIVNPNNTAELSSSDIARIFLGKKRTYSDGTEAIAIHQTEGTPIRTSFVTTLLKKNSQQLKAYWAQLLFTGKGTPPKDVDGGNNVKKLVSENPAFIGYIDSSLIDDTVRVVHEY